MAHNNYERTKEKEEKETNFFDANFYFEFPEFTESDDDFEKVLYFRREVILRVEEATGGAWSEFHRGMWVAFPWRVDIAFRVTGNRLLANYNPTLKVIEEMYEEIGVTPTFTFETESPEEWCYRGDNLH